MKDLNLPPFYVGQRVIYIKNESLAKDSIHTVHSIKMLDCGCWVIHVGLYRMPHTIRCDDHLTPISRILPESESTMFWIDATSFRAIEENFASITYKQAIEVESTLISQN